MFCVPALSLTQTKTMVYPGHSHQHFLNLPPKCCTETGQVHELKAHNNLLYFTYEGPLAVMQIMTILSMLQKWK